MTILGLGDRETSKQHPPTKVCINILRPTESNGKFRKLLEREEVASITLRESSKETAPTTKLTGLRNYPTRIQRHPGANSHSVSFSSQILSLLQPQWLLKVSTTETKCLREMTGVKSQCWFIFSEVSVQSQLVLPRQNHHARNV